MIGWLKIIFDLSLLLLKWWLDPERKREKDAILEEEEIQKFGKAVHEERLRLVGAMLDAELRRLQRRENHHAS